MPVEVDCDWCGETTEKYPSRLDRDNLFCSQDCRAEWQSEKISGENHPKYNRVDVECDWCGSTKKEVPSVVEKNEHFYCDNSCRSKWVSEFKTGKDHWDWERVEVSCDSCGSSLLRQSHRVDGSMQFCDRVCLSDWISENKSGEQSPHWKGGTTDTPYYYGPEWENRREECLKRDSYSCRRCSISEDLHKDKFGRSLEIHHISPFSAFGGDYEEANKLSNLVSLCKSCHHKMEKLSPSEQKELLFGGNENDRSET
jgi:hypothetical protein